MQPNPFRVFENQNYYHTHGHHVENDHTSQTCTMPGPNHNPNATKFNTMGGTNKGAHKTIMPSQCGRTPSTRGQYQATQWYLNWRAAGFPAKPYRGRNNGNQQANQMGGQMPAGQPPMMFFGGAMPPQQNTNFGGNNFGFYGMNNSFGQGNNMGRFY